MELREVTKVYQQGRRTVQAVRGVNLRVVGGEFVVIMGPSGSGKSTLMHLLGALDTPTTGRALFNDRDLQSMSDKERSLLRRNRVGFIFQFFNLLPMLTAEENILLPTSLAGENPDPKFVDELIARVGLEDRRTHRPAELSGGQQQRVAIARALLSRPTVLFADEPTGNLDSKAGDEILQLLRRSVDTVGQTVVMVTHDPRYARYADRSIHLFDGRVVEENVEVPL